MNKLKITLRKKLTSSSTAASSIKGLRGDPPPFRTPSMISENKKYKVCFSKIDSETITNFFYASL